MKPKVFVTRPLPQPALDLVAAACDLEVHAWDAPLSPPELAERCRDAEGIIVCGACLTAEVLEKAPRLRAVANVSVGYDNLDVEACTRRRILVTNTGGAAQETTADLAFALLAAVTRRVVEADRYVREGRWQHWAWNLLWGADLHHRTLGILGFGRIGQAMARRARGFSMRILYHSRHRAPEAVERELEAVYVDRDRLLAESDFVSLHVPLTQETHHLMGPREFSRMKPSAFLINTSRGAVVDEQALVAALEQKQIAGAALDVFEHEPRVHPALLGRDNVVLAPHIGSGTAETRTKMALLAAENLLAALAGKRPPNLVNPEVYAGEAGDA